VPELPDVEVYVEALRERVAGRVLERARVPSASLLRTVTPPLAAAEGRRVQGTRRLGKRVVLELEGALFLVLHLMIAGRLHWKTRGAKLARRGAHAAFDFENGTLTLTEAGTRKRASLHVIEGAEALAAHDPGGLEPLACTPAELAAALRRENHTLKRALTDPRLLSGIGNAYSDEILHRARLSPVAQTHRLDDEAVETLWRACRDVLEQWTARLHEQRGGGFPEKVTAFRPEMAVHGRYGAPCPVCGDPVQRIVYAANETDYCATCQTGGRLLADRALSRLLKRDWPRTIEELEERRGRLRETPGRG
jgi:formamidopyrimidine-DNA glycosylase